MIVDTHAHLDFENYNDNLNEIIERAKENDVKKIIIPGVRADLWENVLKRGETYEQYYNCQGFMSVVRQNTGFKKYKHRH